MKSSEGEVSKSKELLGKKEKMCEQLHKKLNEILNDKSNYLDKIEEIESENKLIKEKLTEINNDKDKINSDYSEKLR